MLIVLDTTTRKLQANLSSGNSTDVTVIVTYADTTTTTFVEGVDPTALNGINVTDVLSAPVANTRRVVKSIMLYNADVSTQTVNLYLYDNGGSYPFATVTLPAGASWASDDQTGVNVGGAVTDGSKGDINVSSGGATWTIADDAVTLAKLAEMASDKLIGRDTASTGNPEYIGVTGGIEFDGAGNIRTTSFSGDVSKAAGGTTTTISNDVVTYAKMQNVSATSRVLGRKTAGSGDTEECTLSEVLDFVGSAAQGDLLYRGSSNWARLAAGTSGRYLQTKGSGANPEWAEVIGGGNTFKNRLINGSFMIDQRYDGAATTITNDAYCFDRWYVLRQTGNVQSSRLTNQSSAPNNIPNAIRLTNTHTSTQKIGLAQIIESNNCRDLRGKSVTLSFKVQTNVSSCTIRYAVLSWTNATADSVVSNVVNDWASTTYTTNNFFINNANIATITTPGTVTPTVDTWTTVTPLTVTLDNSITNVIVFIWTETALTANTGRIDLANVQLEAGSSSTDFEVLPRNVIMMQCMYYALVIGGAATGEVLMNCGTGTSQVGVTKRVFLPFQLGTRLRVKPALSQLGLVSTFTVGDGTGGAFTLTAMDLSVHTGTMNGLIIASTDTTLVEGRPYFLAASVTTSKIIFDSEL